MAKETLQCLTGKHTWAREATRGRKPTHCSKHPAVNTPATADIGPRELHCETGDHKWLREPTRGRVPRSCPLHREAVTITPAPRNENGKEELVCEFDNEKWERLPARGRKPRFCPNHSAGKPASAPVVALTLQQWPADEELLIEVEGEFESETTEAEQRELLTKALNPESRKVGRPKLYASKEEQTEAQLAHSRERAALLEGALKERGTHISQQTPYVLYRKVKETASRTKGVEPTTEWEQVTYHSPLAQAQYINQHEKDFLDGNYRYERDGKVVIL